MGGVLPRTRVCTLAHTQVLSRTHTRAHRHTHTHTHANTSAYTQVLRRVWCLFEIFKTVSFKGVQQLRVLAHGVNLMGLKDIFIRLDVGGASCGLCPFMRPGGAGGLTEAWVGWRGTGVCVCVGGGGGVRGRAHVHARGVRLPSGTNSCVWCQGEGL